MRVARSILAPPESSRDGLRDLDLVHLPAKAHSRLRCILFDSLRLFAYHERIERVADVNDARAL
jgi:hypothetical protein